MFQIFFQFAFLFYQQTYLQKMMLSINTKESLIMKRSKLFFKMSLNMTIIPLIKTHQDTSEACNNFILIFCTIYDTFFPMNNMKIKTKDLKKIF